jgi:hypothetical protein
MKITASLVAIIVVVLACFLVDLDLEKWKVDEGVIENDIHGYYGYLPAYFIFDDLKVEKSEYKYSENGYWFWMKHYDNGKMDFGKTYGLALLYSPFFAVAHQCAINFDYPMTGFSEPYKFFLLLSSLFYLFVGLIFIRKSLQALLFSESSITITLLLLGLGTNLFCYSSHSGPYSHVYNFCLGSIFVYSTILWHERRHWKYFLGLSISFALLTLIYLPNSLIGLFFILYGVRNIKDLAAKKIPIGMLVMSILIFILIWIPQWSYWKLATGSVFGASDPYEKFFFLKPVFLKGLFSFQKGWLIYTPVMIFSIIGIFILRKKHPQLLNPVFIFTLINLYVIFSWWNWWYGGSLGQRAIIDSYAILSLPLAAFVSYILNTSVLIRTVSLGVALFFIWLNIFQTYQYINGSLHYSAMTSKLYFKQFGKMDKVDSFDKLLVYPNDLEARKGNR